MKTCTKCGVEKDISLFCKGKKYKDGYRNVCKRCHTDYMMSYYRKNPDKNKEKIKINTFNKSAWNRHKISKKDYEDLLAKYNGKCHACKERLATCIDHDHNCCDSQRSCGNCIRGVLCNQCNTALGLLNDKKKYIIGLLNYIK